VSKSLLIIGHGGFAKEAGSLAIMAGFQLKGFIDQLGPEESRSGLFGLPVFQSVMVAREKVNCLSAFVAIGDNWTRERVTLELRTKTPELELVCLIHPNSVMSAGAQAGPGSFIGANAFVGAFASVADGNYIAPNTTIGHGSTCGRFSFVSTGARIGGEAHLGDRVMVGMNSVIREKVTVDSDTVVGALSFVSQDFPSKVVVAGSPARIVKSREQNDPYLR